TTKSRYHFVLPDGASPSMIPNPESHAYRRCPRSASPLTNCPRNPSFMLHRVLSTRDPSSTGEILAFCPRPARGKTSFRLALLDWRLQVQNYFPSPCISFHVGVSGPGGSRRVAGDPVGGCSRSAVPGALHGGAPAFRAPARDQGSELRVRPALLQRLRPGSNRP